MTIAELELRVAKLEGKVASLSETANLRHQADQGKNGKDVNTWIYEIHGTIPHNAVSRRAQRLGEKWRKSQRPTRSSRKPSSK